ncbi:hypothetical protein [Erwinia sp.]|uniref:hypothetical protein n=1 Tax=Erwinia citreus TaxID=558 RepID=UPI003C71A8BC
MYRNDEEKLTDIVIGEAVMVLLKDDSAISNTALIKQLQAMTADEMDLARQRACRRAVSEVRGYIADERREAGKDVRDSENVSHMFTNDGPADGTKKH